MRILITGSRDLTDIDVVRKALLEATAGRDGLHRVVHGGARGADSLAGIAAAELGWPVEVHPADWSAPCNRHCKHGSRPERGDGSTYCPAAGMHRNKTMVELGADVVIAFYVRGARNRGTSSCVQLAGRAGLDVKRVVA